MSKLYTAIPILLVAALAPADAAADRRHVRAELASTEEVAALSTTGHGLFRGTLSNDGEELTWELRYDDLEGEVLQAHLHLGQRGVNGGISIFLCSNLGNGPAGTPACPEPPAVVTGTASADGSSRIASRGSASRSSSGRSSSTAARPRSARSRPRPGSPSATSTARATGSAAAGSRRCRTSGASSIA